MYKLLIVEDEVIFRNVLPQIIDWKAIGFEIAAVVENGCKALECLEDIQLDVILTDIRMPVLNGLDLAMEVKARYPKIKVLLLSAFNEFDYARKGIDCGVYGYILKSDDEDEIVKYFTSLKQVLDEENSKSSNNTILSEQRESLFKSLLTCRTMNRSEEEEACKILFATSSEVQVTVFQPDEYPYIVFRSGSDKAQSINHFIKAFLVQHIEQQQKGIVICIDDAVCVFWMIPAFSKQIQEVFCSLTEEIGELKERMDEEISVSCALGGPASDVTGMIAAYGNARKALVHRFYLGHSALISFDDLAKPGEALTFAEEERLIKEILPYFHSRDTQSLIKYLADLQTGLAAKCVTNSDMVSAFAVKLVLALAADMGKMGIKSDAFLMKSNYLIKEIGQLKTLKSIFNKLEAFLVEAFVVMNEDNNVQNRKIVDEAVQFIHKNYAGQIGLEEVARHVNVHPVHLSRLFSRDLGETFKRVLTETRIEEAKRLLRDINYKVYEISGLVGYEKPRYFSELFRSMTGLTPLEYREKYKA